MTTQVTTTQQPYSLGTLLVAQGEQLTEASEKAIAVFKANQEEQKRTIEALTKANAELEARLLRTQAELEQVKAAAAAQKKAHENELGVRAKRLNDFIASAETQMGPILKHLGQRTIISEDFKRAVSPWTLNAHTQIMEEENAYIAGIEVHGKALKHQIDQLKTQ
jgi:dynactin complex subunit